MTRGADIAPQAISDLAGAEVREGMAALAKKPVARWNH